MFCQNQSKSKSRYSYDLFLQQLLDVTGLNDLTICIVIVVVLAHWQKL